MNCQNELKSVSNIEMDNLPLSEISHEMHMRTKDLYRFCETHGIPIFIAYYLQNKGYQYKGLFPEEINTEEVLSEYGKFKQFLKVVIDFNEDYYKPQIKKNKE